MHSFVWTLYFGVHKTVDETVQRGKFLATVNELACIHHLFVGVCAVMESPCSVVMDFYLLPSFGGQISTFSEESGGEFLNELSNLFLWSPV